MEVPCARLVKKASAANSSVTALMPSVSLVLVSLLLVMMIAKIRTRQTSIVVDRFVTLAHAEVYAQMIQIVRLVNASHKSVSSQAARMDFAIKMRAMWTVEDSSVNPV